jgi:hypothetical protein
MQFLFRIALLSCVFAGTASAATPSFDDQPPQDAAIDLPANWSMSSSELPGSTCTSGLCRSGGRVAPADDPVFQFANTAGSEAAPVVVTARSDARSSGAPVPAGIGSVPEPQTYALLFSGLTLLGGLARRRPHP